jgi:hypothetical protein
MAKTITINISDVDEKILYNDLLKDVDGNEGIKDWVERATVGRINHSWKEFRKEWIDRLMADDSFTDTIPSNKEDFINLVTARDDYKDRTAKLAEAEDSQVLR